MLKKLGSERLIRQAGDMAGERYAAEDGVVIKY
jgi:hypothetical protein